jgi:hypothetical protein
MQFVFFPFQFFPFFSFSFESFSLFLQNSLLVLPTSQTLFGWQSPSLPSIQRRDLHAKNPKEVTKYSEAKYAMVEANNICAQIQRLLHDPNLNPALAKSIDTDLYWISIDKKETGMRRSKVCSILMEGVLFRLLLGVGAGVL